MDIATILLDLFRKEQGSQVSRKPNVHMCVCVCVYVS